MTEAEALREDLLAYALSYPDAYPDDPWGETVVKVGKKVFAFLGVDGAPDPRLGVKLPDSAPAARELPGVTPSGYGLGRAGWCEVSLSVAGADAELLREWIDESYRAVCLKRHLRELDN